MKKSDLVKFRKGEKLSAMIDELEDSRSSIIKTDLSLLIRVRSQGGDGARDDNFTFNKPAHEAEFKTIMYKALGDMKSYLEAEFELL